MKLKTAIEKAIKGGFDVGKDGKIKQITNRGILVEFPDANGNYDFREEHTISSLLLDPLFWQSLGKAMGWDHEYYGVEWKGEEWKFHWHRFIDHLAEGKDIESFFEAI